MVENKKRRGLGRGLSSLLDESPGHDDTSFPGGVGTAPLDMIRPNPNQPRKIFPPAELEELTASIREKGILQPLLVRPDPEQPNNYQIIAGERRWRAAQMARLHEAPIIIRAMSDEELLEVALIENVQRADLNPVDEAEGYSQLIERFGHSQADLARVIGKSRPYIANALRLLSLPDPVRRFLADGAISAGHARALITADDPAALCKKIIAEGLSVRQTEDLVRRLAAEASRPTRRRREAGKDADTRALEADLAAALGLKVAISHKGAAGGEIRIGYAALEELDGLCQLLMR